jgi:2-hydroxy-6-oxo-6-(2'-carboxyphenyl)-hexa-2,4-dienoate hydrolase
MDTDFRPSDEDMGQPRWMDVDGIRTRYFDEGSGPTVVFIAGGHFGSREAGSARCWSLNFNALKRHFNCVALDRLGQGYTDNPKRDEDYTMAASLSHAARFLRRLGRGPYHLVGHSRGALFVTRLTMENPELVATTIPVSTGTLSPGIGRNGLVMDRLPQIDPRSTLRTVYERFSYNPRSVTESFLDEPTAIWNSDKFKIAHRKMTVEKLDHKYFTPQLRYMRIETQRWLMEKGMPHPTFLMWGFHDPTADFRNGRVLVRMFMKHQKETELRIFNRCGHYLFREDPASFSRAVHSFISSYK